MSSIQPKIAGQSMIERSGGRLAVLAAGRTPQAKAFGPLADFSAVQLAEHAATHVLSKAGLEPSDVDETIFGNVANSPDATNIARVIALATGIPQDRIAHTVHRNCASGMEAIISAWQVIAAGRADMILAGGTESMSNIPILAGDRLKKKLWQAAKAKSIWQKFQALSSLRLRDLRPIAGIELGLTDASCGLNMGETAEILADEFSISRTEQDQFAFESHRKAVAAAERCFLSGEIIPLKVGNGSEGQREIRQDVGPRKEQSVTKLAKLAPIFKEGGSVTAGNSCPITDGASAMLLASEAQASRFDCPALGFVTAYSIAGCDPRRMGLGPVFATAKLLQQTQLQLCDFDLIEINEAFAAQVIGCMRAFESDKFASEYLGRSKALGEIDPDKLNIHGGAIALGHPVGASGARIVITLLRALKEQGLKRGLATLCVGGGQGVAMIVET